MPELLRSALEVIALLAELAGVAIVVGVSARAFVAYAAQFVRTGGQPVNLLDVRTSLGRGLVLGLEFFVAGDIVKTIVTPTLVELGVLALIVAIRTVLALSLQYEIRQTERTRQASDDR